MIAVVTNMPLNEVWNMSIGQMMRYAACAKTLMCLINPLAAMGESDKKIDMTDPKQAKAFQLMAPALGLKTKSKWSP